MARKKSKKKKIIIIIIIVLIVIFWISSCTRNVKKAMEEISSASTKIDSITKRDLVDSVGATGNIASVDSRNITVDLASAKVKKINVKVGDVVKKGTVLATFDVANTSKDLNDAQNNLNNTKEANNITLEDAKRNLDNLEKKYDTTLKDLKNKMDRAKSIYNESKHNPEIDSDKLYDAYITAKDLYYDTKEELSEKIKNAENEIKKLELSLDTSTQESQIRTYKTQVNNGTIKAPIDGTITSVNYEVGDTYTAGTIFMTIQDCSSYEIKAEVSEYDISKIKLGQSVVIKTDATNDLEMNGVVSDIALVSTKSEVETKSNKTYTVTVSIKDIDERVKLDMSANISIIIDEHKGVLTVPYNAVYTDKDGKYYLKKLLDNNEKENVYIDVVMESSYYTEIEGNNIYEGMKIVIENIDDENPFLTLMQNGGF